MAAVTGLGFLTSCEMVNEDLGECPQGVSLRFVFDYNMERANAFPAQVDCITLYVFDATGALIEKHHESTSVLSDENYRMTLDLGPGEYSFVALGGSTCEKNSFKVENLETRDDRRALSIELPLDIKRHSSVRLHDLFYGELDKAAVAKDVITTHTIYMIKDTNSVQVTLQEISAPYSVNAEDYEFFIEADNDLLDYNNNTIPNGGMGYNPFTTENRVAGFVDYGGNTVVEDEGQKVQVAVSEFNMSRLMTQNSDKSYIVVRSAESGAEIIRVPLIEYMLLSKHNSHSWIKTDQEYLDRQSTWNFMFFLQNGKWIQSRVAVNNWILRFNHADV